MSNTTLNKGLGWLTRRDEPIGPYEYALLSLGIVAVIALGGSTLGLCILLFAGCASGLFPGSAAPWVAICAIVLTCIAIVYNGSGMPGALGADLDYQQFYDRVYSNMAVFISIVVSLSFYAGSLARKARVKKTMSSVLFAMTALFLLVGAYALYLPHVSAVLERERLSVDLLLDRYRDDLSKLGDPVPGSTGLERKAVGDRFTADFLGRRYEGLVGDAYPKSVAGTDEQR